MVGQWSGEDVEEIRARVYVPLSSRRGEMETVIFSRIRAVPTPLGTVGSEHANGLRRAVSAGVDHGLSSVEGVGSETVRIPPVLFTQARQAARKRIALDVVLRRYVAGYSAFCDFVIWVIEDGLPLSVLRRLLHRQAALFERLIDAVAREYTRESASRCTSAEGRQVECVKKLLVGEPADAAELAYELEDWHVGAIVRGNGAVSTLRDLAEVADRRLLLVRPQKDTAWAWFGGRRRVEMAELARRMALEADENALIALGEPARGVDGWRLTHQQASAAFEIGGGPVVRYTDVGLLASISKDRLLAGSLRQLYLAPLADGRDGGAGLRETLRAYFAAGRNISSAASALGVSRQTVGNRLRTIEGKLGRNLESCAPEIEVALRLESVDDDFGTAAGPSTRFGGVQN